mgnify:CR=1 FL=1
MSDTPKPSERAVTLACLVYTIAPVTPGSGVTSKIMEHFVIADPFSVDPRRIIAGDTDERVIWFPVTARRRISYSPTSESTEYGPGFIWEEVVETTDYPGVVPNLFAMKTRGKTWYRTFEDAKTALFSGMLALAENEIDRLTDLVTEMGEEAEMVADAARAG